MILSNPGPEPDAAPAPGLNAGERDCLDLLAQAWNLFAALEDKHPQDDAEFCKAIHDLQKLIALRVARRADPGVWARPRDLRESAQKG
jgi:hypothetical protein